MEDPHYGDREEIQRLRARVAKLENENEILAALANRYHLDLTRSRNELEKIRIESLTGD